MKLRLFFIDEHNSSKQNGIGTYRNILIAELARNGVVIGLVSLNSDTDNFHMESRNYGLEYLVPSIAGGNWRGNGGLIVPILSRYIADCTENVFLVNHSPSAPFIESLRCSFPLSKVVFVVHDQWWCASLMGSRALLVDVVNGNGPFPSDVAQNYIFGEQSIYSVVDKVVALSPSARSVLEDLYKVPEHKLSHISNGYAPYDGSAGNREDIRNKFGFKPDDKILIFSARPARHKGVVAMLKVMVKLKSLHPSLRCVMACSLNGLCRFDNLVSAAAPSLILTGYLDRKSLLEWYAAADVGIITSYTEQCSYSAMEMMDSGLTIVSSDGHGLADMFVDGRNAFVANIESVSDDRAYVDNIVKAVNRALNAPASEINRMKTENRKLLHTVYSPAVMAEKYIRLFSELTA